MSELKITGSTEEDKYTASKRQINKIWEITQAVIAIEVSGVTLYVASSLAIYTDGATEAFLLLSNAFFLVIGFYFGRTNHRSVGDMDISR